MVAMHPLFVASMFASLALLHLPLLVRAEAVNSRNLTLRFFASDQEDSCNYNSTQGALTFTTTSIPAGSFCFKVSSLFGGNATKGYRNDSQNIGTFTRGDLGIHWYIQNMDKYDYSANYSRMFYRQYVANPLTDGHYADRRVQLWSGEDCTERDPYSTPENPLPPLPWYGISCLSEDQGNCGKMPYNIKSFSVQSGLFRSAGECWIFAQRGHAVSIHPSLRTIVGAFVTVTIIIFMAF